jgi:16S rRNA processing protein RimM
MTTSPGPGSADPGSPPHDEATLPADAVEVARVLGAWGVKGGIKLKAFSADPQALFSSKRWFVEPANAS